MKTHNSILNSRSELENYVLSKNITTQTALAKELGVSPQYVEQSLSKTGNKQYFKELIAFHSFEKYKHSNGYKEYELLDGEISVHYNSKNKVTNYGNILTLYTFNKIGINNRVWVKKQPFICKTSGYIKTSISNKDLYVHRIVAELFLKNPYNLPFVIFKDGDKTNINVNNLMWSESYVPYFVDY